MVDSSRMVPSLIRPAATLRVAFWLMSPLPCTHSVVLARLFVSSVSPDPSIRMVVGEAGLAVTYSVALLR